MRLFFSLIATATVLGGSANSIPAQSLSLKAVAFEAEKGKGMPESWAWEPWEWKPRNRWERIDDIPLGAARMITTADMKVSAPPGSWLIGVESSQATHAFWRLWPRISRLPAEIRVAESIGNPLQPIYFAEPDSPVSEQQFHPCRISIRPSGDGTIPAWATGAVSLIYGREKKRFHPPLEVKAGAKLLAGDLLLSLDRVESDPFGELAMTFVCEETTSRLLRMEFFEPDGTPVQMSGERSEWKKDQKGIATGWQTTHSVQLVRDRYEVVLDVIVSSERVRVPFAFPARNPPGANP